MDVPSPTQAVAALASFVRDRLLGVSTTMAPVLSITTAAEPFAPSSYSRARLIRQMHATGLLADDPDTVEGPDGSGVPRAR